MRNAVVIIIALLTVSFVLVMGELANRRDDQPDFQAYSKRFEQINEATK